MLHTTKKDSVVNSSIKEIKSVTAKSNEVTNANYKRLTQNNFTAIIVDSSYEAPPGIISIRKGSQQKIFLPISTVTEWGNIAANMTKETTNDNKTVSKSQSHIATVVKEKQVSKKNKWIAFFLSLVFVLFCCILLLKKFARFSFVNLIKKYL